MGNGVKPMADHRRIERALERAAQAQNEGMDVDGLGLLTPGEVAALLHVDANTVARWSNEGRVRSVRTPGGHRRYPVSEVLRLARGSAFGAAEPQVPAARTPEPRRNGEAGPRAVGS